MTTIATDGRTIAGDGQAEVAETILCSERAKVHRLSDGSLVGCSGQSVDCNRFREWLESAGARPKVQALQALVLKPDGTLEYWNELLDPTHPDIPCAVGSGMDFAIGAMEAGATPEEAVRIASKRDPFTGGKITVLSL